MQYVRCAMLVSLLLGVLAQAGCDQAASPTSSAAIDSNENATPVVEESFKTWTLPGGIEVSAWGSGDNHIGETTYLWTDVGANGQYIKPDQISNQIEQPDGVSTPWRPLNPSPVEEAGDPNYGATFTPTQNGRHRVAVKLAVQGQAEETLQGLVFDVE